MTRNRSRAAASSVVDRTLADFIEGPVSIALASRRDDLVPELVRAHGCRALPDGRVVIVVARTQSEAVLECVEAGHPIAVTFSHPSSHRTVQLKARSASVSAAARADVEVVARHRRELAEDLARIGFGGAFADALLDSAPEDLLALTFCPHEAFDQTPGPEAGHTIACCDEQGERKRRRS